MPIDRYRLTMPVLALYEQNEFHVAAPIPQGAIVTIDSATFDGNKLVTVLWEGKSVMMFTEDLRRHGEAVLEAGITSP